MLPLERQNQILTILKEKGAVRVEELCSALYSSGATIRRDLQLLETSGMIRRTHGGAVHLDNSAKDFPLTLRQTENLRAKDRIAEQALPLIRDGQTLFMDSSSTVSHIAQRLGTFQGLKVITNGLKTAEILSAFPHIQVYGTGGKLRQGAMSYVGSGAVDNIRRFHGDIAFLSCRGIHPTVGVTESNEEEAYIKKVFAENAEKVCICCDATKLNQQHFCKVLALEEVDTLLTDTTLTPEYRKKLRQR